MSDQRRTRWKSGRLVSSPLTDGWAIDLDSRDPGIPNLPLEAPASDGGSATGAFSAAWGIRNAQNSGAYSAAWSIRNAATASQAAAWSLRNNATATKDGAWSVRNSQAGAYSAAWSLRNSQTGSYESAWSIEGLASAAGSYSSAWSVANAAAASFAAAWSIRNAAAGQFGIEWSVDSDAPDESARMAGPGASDTSADIDDDELMEMAAMIVTSGALEGLRV